MILYHGSNITIETIDFNKCKPGKDFGKGFYLTDIKQQAEEMARRSVRIAQKGEPVVTTYDFNISCLSDGSLFVKIFEKPTKEWALFILENRKNKGLINIHPYDIVVGPVADDGIVYQLERYRRKMITLDTLVNELTYQKVNNQYFFGTDKAVNNLIKL